MLGEAPPVINIPTIRMIDLKIHIEKNDFTMKELQIVIKNLKNNKASRIDNIPAEVRKGGICNENYYIFVTESIISNLLIYGDKVASFLYHKKVTCVLLPTTEEIV